MGRAFITTVSILGALALNAVATVPLAAQSYADPAYTQGQEILSPRELDSLLAPIALYPDQLLSQVLMAATYPHDVEEAAEWTGRATNASLRGDALAFALEGWEWDASVKTLAQFPDVLQMLDEEYDWTVRVGNAFLLQERDVMDSIQRLRHQARAAGNLRSNEYQNVYFDGAAIVIDMIDPQTVYVPRYEPLRVYGAWLYPDYPPVYFRRPLVVTRYVVVPRLWGWSSWDWNRHRIRLDLPRYRYFYRSRDWSHHDGYWRHDGRRRWDVTYPRDRRGPDRDRNWRDNDGRRDNDRWDNNRWNNDRRDGDRNNGPRANVRPDNMRPDRDRDSNDRGATWNRRDGNEWRNRRGNGVQQAAPPGSAPQEQADEQNIRRRLDRNRQDLRQLQARPDRNRDRDDRSRQAYAGPRLTPPAPVAPIVTSPTTPAAPRMDRPAGGEGRQQFNRGQGRPQFSGGDQPRREFRANADGGGEPRVRNRSQGDGGNGGEVRQPRRNDGDGGNRGRGNGPRGGRERNPQ